MDWKLGLNFYSTEVAMFSPFDLGQKEVIETIQKSQFHIYIVGKRKKLFFDHSSRHEDGSNRSILYMLDNNHNKEYVEFINLQDIQIISHENGYFYFDHKELKNQKIRDFSLVTQMFKYKAMESPSFMPVPSDFEVLYIGQAFGRKTKRKIDYRLSNHEKIQQIALDILNRGSNEEILVIGIKIEVSDHAILLTNFGKKSQDNFDIKDLYQLGEKAKKRVTEGQEVTIFEASLIRHFRPTLNKEHKQTFPTNDFRSYEEIYQTDFDYTTFAIDTKPLHTRLFSEFVTDRKFGHTHHFPLEIKRDKKGLFDFIVETTNFE